MREMELNRSKLLERAENARTESKHIDFKSQFDISSVVEWCEIIKDIVAFANSGGGVILFGVNNDGSNADFDTTEISKLDIADITNKIEPYTGFHFAEIEVAENQA
jgi:predicted HTH transcriptional regulator